MSSKKQKGFCLFFALFFSYMYSQKVPQQPSMNFEFINQNIRDILYSLSVFQKIPIVADDTVSGSATLQYSGNDFNSAFDTFLSINRLFVVKTDTLWTVSKIKLTYNEDKTLNVEVLDLSPYQIFEHISSFTGQTIVHDILPSTKSSIRLFQVSVFDALEIIMKPYPDYMLVTSDKFIQIKKNQIPSPALISSPTGSIKIHESGGSFTVNGERFKVGEALDVLFRCAKQEYTSFVRNDVVIEKLSFSGKSLPDTLELILDQASAEFTNSGGIWYILPGQQSETLKKLQNEGTEWIRYPLKFIKYSQIVPFLNSRYPSLIPVPIPDGNGFFARVTPIVNNEIVSLIQSIDITGFRGVVHIKYIKPEELLQFIPPSIKKENLVDSGNGHTLFFIGTQEQFLEFSKELEIIDRPKKRVRYDLLIMQYQDSSDLKWGFNSNARKLSPGDQTAITGSLGNILKLNFDVISVLGYQFALQLDTAIGENQANVFADTTLYGLSGQEIKFHNTNTYRYRDYYIDAQTKEAVYTGVTREITSGLVLNINGWVSGDGMVTTTVNASVSKRGADISSKVGNPPPTSEKTITTQVRSRSGESVILSGLRQDDSTFVEERVPFISKVPIVGWLFKTRQSSNEKTQMIIYLIPHIENDYDEMSGLVYRTESIYERFVDPIMESYVAR